jgi:hypothetical protein
MPPNDRPVAMREVIVCQPGAEGAAIEAERAERAERATTLAVRRAEEAARLAIAENKMTHAQIQREAMLFVLGQVQKWNKMAEHPDFQNALGPLDPKVVIKLADFATKNFRLDTGQSTENIAHAVTRTVDFSKLTQEERNAWRALALKAGAGQE